MEILIFFIGVISGFLGATVGGGGFVSIPVLMFLGFSPQSAIALNKVGDIGTFISAVSKYWKSQKIDWSVAGIIVLIYICGSFIGANIMIELNVKALEILIGVSILLALPFIFINKKLGLKEIKVSRIKRVSGFVILFFLSILGAMIGAGGAVLSTIVMMFFLGYEIVDGHATTTPSKFFSALIPSIIYYFNGFVDIVPALFIFIGMLIGGFFGARTAILEGNSWIKKLFLIVVLFLVGKLLFF